MRSRQAECRGDLSGHQRTTFPGITSGNNIYRSLSARRPPQCGGPFIRLTQARTACIARVLYRSTAAVHIVVHIADPAGCRLANVGLGSAALGPSFKGRPWMPPAACEPRTSRRREVSEARQTDAAFAHVWNAGRQNYRARRAGRVRCAAISAPFYGLRRLGRCVQGTPDTLVQRPPSNPLISFFCPGCPGCPGYKS